MKTSTCVVSVAVLGLAFCLPPTVANAGPVDAPVTAESIRQGLVLHLPFDSNAAGGKVLDASGQGNHAKASGVRWTANGRSGGAYEFRTDGDQIVVPNNAGLNPQHLTLAAWIKTAAADRWRRIFDKSYSQGYALSIAADWQGNKWGGLASMEIGPGNHFNLTRTVVADGKWHHLVSTFDGTEQLLYVDGRPEGQALLWDSPGQVGKTSFNLVIGCNGSDRPETGLGESFRGLIDEPMMWNRALSPKEVAFLAGGAAAAGNEAAAAMKSALHPSSNAGGREGAMKLLAGVSHFTDNDLRFRTTSGVTVFVDPVSWPWDRQVAQSGLVIPDLILITHRHGDHFQPTMLREYLSLNPKAVLAGPPDVVKLAQSKGMSQMQVVTPGKSYTIAGIAVRTVPACFLEGNSHPQANQWVGYLLQLNGASYYVTGDTQPLPGMGQLKVDVLFPLLFGCGGNLEQAVKMAELCHARVVVPVHTSGQEAIIKKYLAQLPKGVQGAYYKDTTLIAGPEVAKK
jgi:L-ascorbate metabolism protein UlaG (beta-lactamase superfamily)